MTAPTFWYWPWCPKDSRAKSSAEIDNRSFLRLALGSLLGLVHRREGEAAMMLAKQMLAWCPMDNIGVRFGLVDIALLKVDHKPAM